MAVNRLMAPAVALATSSLGPQGIKVVSLILPIFRVPTT
jgi:hypothetical protein